MYRMSMKMDLDLYVNDIKQRKHTKKTRRHRRQKGGYVYKGVGSTAKGVEVNSRTRTRTKSKSSRKNRK